MEVYTLIIWLVILGSGVLNGQSVSVELNITDGSIIGTKRYTVVGNLSFYAFKGIPYAEPPVGDLRFQPAIAVKPWTDSLNCTYDKSECVQGSDPVSGSEDCLFINVYTRSLTEASGVLVYIHGGAFTEGNSSEALQPPDHFLSEGLVFVEFNYRIGVFGFMSTEDLACPGNLGLKDQVLALKWIQNNIGYFGGDPKNVTLFGQSAGAVSISYHMQSNLSVGLFQKTIMNSGTSLCLWSRARKARTTAFEVGVALGILTTNSTVLLERLRNISYDTLQTAASQVYTIVTLQNVLDGLAFAPVKEIVHDGAFFTGQSEDALLKGNYTKVPSLLGVNSNEAAAASSATATLRALLVQNDLSLTTLAPADLTKNVTSKATATKIIKCCYYECLSITLAPGATIIQFLSDDQFNRPVLRTAADLSLYSPTYLYKFSYVGLLGGSLNRTVGGVGHTEELPYFFTTNFTNISEEDILMSRRAVRLWSNFAKFGNPTPTEDPLLQNVTWSVTERENLTYLNIDSKLELSVKPFNGCIEVYVPIYNTYGTPPHYTY